MQRLSLANHCYLVGGAVRDQLLGLPVIERDWVVVGSSARQLIAAGFKQVGSKFPVYLHPDSKEEYALARRERNTGPAYRDFAVDAGRDVSLREDLLRRDLTINAIACSMHGELVDPYGGQTDLCRRQLRHVSDAFREDPVRVLRLARLRAQLAPLGFRLHPSTQKLVQTMARDGELMALVAERVWQELHKALNTSAPQLFFQTLWQCNALTAVFPEYAALARYPARWQSFMNALARSAELSAAADIRFAVLAASLGSELSKFIARLRIPNRFAKLGLLLNRHVATLLRLDPSNPHCAQHILEILEACDAMRRPLQLQRLMHSLVALKTASNVAMRSRRLVLSGYRAATNLSGAALHAKGLSGKQLRNALQRARLEAISDGLNAYAEQCDQRYL